MTLSGSSLKSTLLQQARFYHDQLPDSPAARYLVEERGFDLREIERFGLGYSGIVEPGHSIFQHRLVIPYLRRMAGDWFVVGLKFRKIGDDVPGAKYLGEQSPQLFNTIDAIDNHDEIGLCEGELDALAASIAGIPSVGYPGTETWQPYFTPIFRGYETVWVFADGDQPGRDAAKRLKKTIGSPARVIEMPDGYDVNRYVKDFGATALRELIGR
jgi:DNA primase